MTRECEDIKLRRRVGAGWCAVAMPSLLLVFLFTFAVTGCSKSPSAPAAGTDSAKSELPEVTGLRKAFESADTRTRFAADEILQMVRAGLYNDAVSNLQKFEHSPGLTPEQLRAVQDLIKRLRAGPPK